MRNVLFGLLVAAVVASFSAPLTTLLQFSFRQEHYSHIVLIPLVSAALVILERRRIFTQPRTAWLPGLAALSAGMVLATVGQRSARSLSVNDQLSLAIFGVVLAIIGGFVLCHGLHAGRAALFPLSFLVLTAPIPDALLSRAIAWLQVGSAEVSHVLFELVGVPVLRNGFAFSLPGVMVEIAEECSGIRSSLALLITSLLIGHLMLRSVWAKGALMLATLPLLVIKNGIRIVTLSVLAVYVDPRFLSGDLHQRGGIVFFVISLAFLALVLRWLQKSEQRFRTAPVGSGPLLSKDAGLTDVAS